MPVPVPPRVTPGLKQHLSSAQRVQPFARPYVADEAYTYDTTQTMNPASPSSGYRRRFSHLVAHLEGGNTWTDQHPISNACPVPSLTPTIQQLQSRDTASCNSRQDPTHLQGLLAILGNQQLGGDTVLLHRGDYLSPSPKLGTRSYASSYLRTTSSSDSLVLPDITYVLRGALEPPEWSESNAMPGDDACQECSLALLEQSKARSSPLREQSPSYISSAFSTDPETFAPLCEPFSVWIAEYMWKVVTTGMNLPLPSGESARNVSFPMSPQPLLAESICSLLLSTLLQPSVIFLSLHYITRLPAFIGSHDDDLQRHSAAYQFRTALCSVDATSHECPVTRALYASFKLFVVGAILSNKVLDDHVFTLKTWHEVSGIPLVVLNKLEWLSLDILGHKLYVEPPHWNRWIHQLSFYHRSLASGGTLAPSHSLIAGVLEGLSEAQLTVSNIHGRIDPTFLGIRDRINTKERAELQACQNIASILDLDENGPLRAEYLPRRQSQRRRSQTSTENVVPGGGTPYTFPTHTGTLMQPQPCFTAVNTEPSCGDNQRSLMGNTTTMIYRTSKLLDAPIYPPESSVRYVGEEASPYSSNRAATDEKQKSATLCDYFLYCSRIQGHVGSAWTPVNHAVT